MDSPIDNSVVINIAGTDYRMVASMRVLYLMSDLDDLTDEQKEALTVRELQDKVLEIMEAGSARYEEWMDVREEFMDNTWMENLEAMREVVRITSGVDDAENLDEAPSAEPNG